MSIAVLLCLRGTNSLHVALQVACTALGVNHCLLKGRVFDMCIVDEAGQMTLPVALGTLLHSRYNFMEGNSRFCPWSLLYCILPVLWAELEIWSSRQNEALRP